MLPETAFIFASQPANEGAEGCFRAVLPHGISSVDELMTALAATLRFPAYFGENWNALSDCLRDFDWIDERTIYLVHIDLPQFDVRELRIYLEVLLHAVRDWKPGERHELRVVFPEASAATTRLLMT